MDYTEVSKKINTVRIKLSKKEFLDKELREALKAEKVPYSWFLPGALKKAEKIKKVGRKFVICDKPIYKTLVQEWMEEALQYHKIAHKRCAKTKGNKIIIPTIISNPTEDAILLLKEKGYKIFEQFIEYREV